MPKSKKEKNEKADVKWSEEANVFIEKRNDLNIRKDIKTSICSKITMEPVLAGAMFAICLIQTSFQNIYLESACLVDLAQPRNECVFGFADKMPMEMESQKLVAEINISRGFVGGAIVTCVLLFLAPWSDYSGRRKPTILVPLAGMCTASLNVLIILLTPRVPLAWVVYAIQMPLSLGGGFVLLFIGVFNYIGDICYSTGRDATTVMGSNRAAMQAAVVFGAILGPITYRALGFLWVFGIAFSIQLFSLIFAWIYVSDVNVNKENDLSVLNIRLPMKALWCVFKKRQDYKRCSILLMILIASLDKLITSGDISLSYMYMRNQFNWADVLYGTFLAYKSILSFFGTLLILNVLRKRFSASDYNIGIMGGISQTASILVMILSTNNYLIFFSGFVGILAQGILVVQRPLMNRQIKADEQGQISSVTGALDSIMQLALNPLYNAIYSSTADTFPGAFLCISMAAGTMQAVGFFIAMILNNRNDKKHSVLEMPLNRVGESDVNSEKSTVERYELKGSSSEIGPLHNHKVLNDVNKKDKDKGINSNIEFKASNETEDTLKLPTIKETNADSVAENALTNDKSILESGDKR